MEMKYEDFIEVLREVSESQGLNSGNILKRAQDKLKERSDENGIDSVYTIVYSTFKSNSFYKNYEFKLQMSDGTTASGTLLHFAIQCNNELLVKLLLENEPSIVMKNYSGLPPLHIAASYGYENMVQLLLGDKRVNPLLKDAQGRTPREMVETIDNIQNREIIIKRLEKAEESYRTKLQNKAKNPLQDSHRAPASLTVNGDNVTTVLGNGKGKLAAVRVQVWDESKKENNGNVRSKQTSSNSITDESSGSTVNEQYQRVSVKNMVEKFEPSQKINITCSSKQAPAIESDGDDSGLELGPETAPSTSLHFEMNIDGTNNVERDVDNQTLESTLRSQIQLKDSRIRELEDSDEKLK
ncbi:MAG: ankyrin repeat domain-containing protein [Rickettsiales bacterium]|jgi:hypothetical protein|nr:ankyrin repeat domain-containing protein [Rickettsiales bacterium]